MANINNYLTAKNEWVIVLSKFSKINKTSAFAFWYWIKFEFMFTFSEYNLYKLILNAQ